MKAAIAIFALVLALFSVGCGGDDAATTTTAETKAASAESSEKQEEFRFPIASDQGDPHFATISYAGGGKRPKPKIDPPNLPPPKRLLVRDIEVGTGPVARRGDEVGVYYIGTHYETGRETFLRWPPASPPWALRLGSGGSGEGFEAGIEGMRVGGRREVLIPARLMYGNGAMDYVIDLVSVGPAKEKPLRFPPVSDRNDPRFATVSSAGRAEIKIEPSDRPPPKRLLLRDIEVGSGPAARPGDRVAVFYIGVDYGTGKKTIETWPSEAEALKKVIKRDNPVAWEEGVVGMRVGGRREMIIPAGRALGTGALDYVFDLVGLEPGPKARTGG